MTANGTISIHPPASIHSPGTWYLESRISSQHVASAADVLAEGDEVTALVRRTEPGSRVELTTRELEPEPGDMLREPQLVYSRAPQEALPKVGDLVMGTVTSIKPLGAFVDLGSGLIGLLAASNFSASPVTNLEEFMSIGDEVTAQVKKVNNKEKRQVSLSTKVLEPEAGDMLRDPKAVYQRADETARMRREALPKVYDLVSGRVAAIRPSRGAYIDLGSGVVGRLMIRDVSASPVTTDLGQLMAVGDEVKAQVKTVDKGTFQVWLSTKVLEPEPGDMLRDPKTVYERAEETWRLRREALPKPGDLVAGKVMSVVPSGAWLDLGKSVPGFLHVSRISSQHVDSAADVLAEGDEVTALVRRTEPGSRVELSVQELEPQPGTEGN
ncbi:hypothetical protein GPECTOR_68g346 [Gonium pectorale]|uniref:S1 motif domain-containing protein n=1 Tax=Gonium pectorale TaxID=33097 RepID=A0A150G4C4_GONPE|nr:hypothetical protein GPECTOR_68g346 [Gonium pectorale]|eukprot:KXZ44375.1 hypothetical protein GPECTOR_68g346 [Gonium pectorale]